MFPDNEEINNMINILQSNQEEGYQSEIKKENSKTFNKTNYTAKSMPRIENKPIIKPVEEKTIKQEAPRKLTQQEIAQKVEEYKLKLNQNLLTKLAEERQKEDDRERALNLARDKTEWEKLEKQFGLERAQASNRIVKYNE